MAAPCLDVTFVIGPHTAGDNVVGKRTVEQIARIIDEVRVVEIGQGHPPPVG